MSNRILRIGLFAFFSLLISIPATDADEIVLVRDINPGEEHSVPVGMFDHGGVVFFHARHIDFGPELWKSDGTAAGTSLVRDLVPGPDGQSLGIPSFGSLSDRLFWHATDVAGLGPELWSSDGTEAGTVLVKEILDGPRGSTPQNFTNFLGMLFFSATSRFEGNELWLTDGSPAGTMMVADSNPGGLASGPGSLTPIGGELFFAGTLGRDRELWKSDGTEAGTVLVKNIDPSSSPPPISSPNGSSPAGFRNLEGILIFHADDIVKGRELWRSDGTEAGTTRVRDINPGAADSFLRTPRLSSVQVMNGNYYFRADDGLHGEELWRSDGTMSGTLLVSDINPGLGDSAPDNFAVLDDMLYFSAMTADEGEELWRSDGTEAGTVLVKDIRPGVDGSNPSRLTEANGRIFFSAFLDATGIEIWRSDGTEDGTTLVEDLYPGAEGSVRSGTEIFDIDGLLFLSLLTPELGLELYKIDTRGPRCDGFEATIHVDEMGRIHGGQLDGQIFHGVLLGTAGRDVILGTPGNDILVGFRGADLMCGEAGNDRLLGLAGDDQLDGGEGFDTLVGGPGDDSCSNGEVQAACN